MLLKYKVDHKLKIEHLLLTIENYQVNKKYEMNLSNLTIILYYQEKLKCMLGKKNKIQKQKIIFDEVLLKLQLTNIINDEQNFLLIVMNLRKYTDTKNPKLPIKSKRFKSNSIYIDNFLLDSNKINFDWYEDLKISTWITKSLPKNFKIINQQFIFSWKWTIENPQIWDIRISYQVILPWKEGVVLWIKKLNKILPYIDKKWNKIYRFFEWTKQEALLQLHKEYQMYTRIVRIVWFLLMRIWLQMILWILPVLSSVIPFLWNTTSWIIKFITFPISIIITIITIIVGRVFHNLLLMILVGVVWIISIILISKFKK